MEVAGEIDMKTLPRKALVRAMAEEALELKKADDFQYTPSARVAPDLSVVPRGDANSSSCVAQSRNAYQNLVATAPADAGTGFAPAKIAAIRERANSPPALPLRRLRAIDSVPEESRDHLLRGYLWIFFRVLTERSFAPEPPGRFE